MQPQPSDRSGLQVTRAPSAICFSSWAPPPPPHTHTRILHLLMWLPNECLSRPWPVPPVHTQRACNPQHLTRSKHPTVVEPRPETRSTDSHVPQLKQEQTSAVQSRGHSTAVGPSYNLGVKRACIAGLSQLILICVLREGRDTPYFFCQPLPRS